MNHELGQWNDFKIPEANPAPALAAPALARVPTPYNPVPANPVNLNGAILRINGVEYHLTSGNDNTNKNRVTKGGKRRTRKRHGKKRRTRKN